MQNELSRLAIEVGAARAGTHEAKAAAQQVSNRCDDVVAAVESLKADTVLLREDLKTEAKKAAHGLRDAELAHAKRMKSLEELVCLVILVG